MKWQGNVRRFGHIEIVSLATFVWLLSCSQNALSDDATRPNPSGAASQSTPVDQSQPERGPFAIAGQVVNEQGQPEVGVVVRLLAGDQSKALTSDAEGKFQFLWSRPDWIFGLITAQNADGSLQGISSFHQRPQELLRLTLKPARECQIAVTDSQGAPVAEARVLVLQGAFFWRLVDGLTDVQGKLLVRVPADSTVSQVVAFKSRVGFDYYSTLPARQSPDRDVLPASVSLKLVGARVAHVKVTDSAGRPVAGLRLYPENIELPGKPESINLFASIDLVGTTTDESGVATFDYLPLEVVRGVEFSLLSPHFHPLTPPLLMSGGSDELTLPVLRTTKLSGQVTFADGRPAAGFVVSADGTGKSLRGGRRKVFTNSAGEYEMLTNSEEAYIVSIADDQWAAPSRDGVIVREDRPVNGIDFVLDRGTIVRGRVTIGSDGRPGSNAHVYLRQIGAETPPELRRSLDQHQRTASQRFLQADADGNYQTCLAPGKYTIDGGELVVESQLEIVRDLRQPFRGKARLTGHVLDSKGEPVVGALVSGVYPSFTQQDLNTKTRSDGQFLVMRSLEPLILSARSPDGGEGSITTIDAEKTEVTLRLAPAASAVGKLVGETRQPVTDFEIRYGIKVFLGKPNENQWRRGCLGGSVKTDAEGRFKIPGLVIGQQYAITYRPSFVPEEAWCTIAEVTPREAGLIELGVTQALSEPKPYQPPTIEERTAEFFKDRGPLAERVAKAQGEARRCYLRVLVVMGDPASRASQKFLDARDHKRMNDYQWIGLAAASAEARAAIKRQFGDTTAELTLPALVALDESGDVLDKISLPFDGPDEPAAVAACNKFLDQHALPQLDAENLLSDALDRARREDKRVIVQETASWCGPCRMLTRFIDRHKAMFDEHFVYIKIDRERFRHGDEVMQRLRAKRSGIPWVVILDRDEKPLGFSEIKPGETYGFPTEPEEIDQFLGLLAKSAPRLPPAQEKELRADLEIKDRTGL